MISALGHEGLIRQSFGCGRYMCHCCRNRAEWTAKAAALVLFGNRPLGPISGSANPLGRNCLELSTSPAKSAKRQSRYSATNEQCRTSVKGDVRKSSDRGYVSRSTSVG